MCHLSSQACPCCGEVDLGNHGNGVRGDERRRIPGCHEEAEVLVVVDDFVSDLHHVTGTCNISVSNGTVSQRVSQSVSKAVSDFAS